MRQPRSLAVTGDLLLLCAAAAAFLHLAAAATGPSCTLQASPQVLSSGAVIPTTASGLFHLQAPGNYTFADSSQEANWVQSGVTLCVIGQGASRDDVVVRPGGGYRHLVLRRGSSVHLERLTLQGTSNGGGAATKYDEPSGNRTLTTNNVKFSQQSQLFISGELTGAFHDSEWSDNAMDSDGGAAVKVNLDTGAATFSWTGTTLFARNKATSDGKSAAFGGAIFAAASSTAAASRAISLAFDGDISFRDNEAQQGGAIWTSGAVDVSFRGSSLEMSGNKAPGIYSHPGLGGAIMVGDGSSLGASSNAPSSSLEFHSTITRFIGNVAGNVLVSTAPASGAALYLQGHGNGHNIRGVFSQNVIFANNLALPTESGMTGGVLSILPITSTTVDLLVEKQMTFENNRVETTPPTSKFYGAAIAFYHYSQPPQFSSVIRVNTTGGLIFFNNTVNGVDQDVWIKNDNASAIFCGTSAPKLGGTYYVTCDLCSSACSAFTSGNVTCNACPSSTTSGCTAPPTFNGTLITGYASCSAAPAVSSGTYPVNTSCIATCAPGSSGGFANAALDASGACVWQVQPCAKDCAGNPLPVAGAEPWQCGQSTVVGGSCRAACSVQDGFAGGPVTAVCASGGQWSNTTSGTCTRQACIGPPPVNPPNATFLCSRTPVGQQCSAVCNAGLSSGSAPSRVCLADGQWGPLTGDACVDCVANMPQLEAPAAAGSFPSGSTAVAATFRLVAPFITGANLSATLDGTLPCTTFPAQVSGAQATPGRAIQVSCQAPAALNAGPHTIALTAELVGSNGCNSGSAEALARVVVAAPQPLPAPAVKLSPAANTPSSTCKAGVGKQTQAQAVFSYEVTPAADAGSGLAIDASASAAEATCTVRRAGNLQSGTLTVSCQGVFDALKTLRITTTLSASSVPAGSSLVGTAASSMDIAFVCCSASNSLALAVNTDGGGQCLTCGTGSRVEGVWLQGSVTAAALRSGALAATTCSSNGVDVGSITTVCDPAVNDRLLRVTVISPSGSDGLKLQYLTRCNSPISPGTSCIEGGYGWRTANEWRNNLKVTTNATGTITTFSILSTGSQAACACNSVYYAIQAKGSFGLGPVSSSGACPESLAASKPSKKTVRRP